MPSAPACLAAPMTFSKSRYDSAAVLPPSAKASSASRTNGASRSGSAYTATLPRPASRQARMTRTAISPRLAIRTFRNCRVASAATVPPCISQAVSTIGRVYAEVLTPADEVDPTEEAHGDAATHPARDEPSTWARVPPAVVSGADLTHGQLGLGQRRQLADEGQLASQVPSVAQRALGRPTPRPPAESLMPLLTEPGCEQRPRGGHLARPLVPQGLPGRVNQPLVEPRRHRRAGHQRGDQCGLPGGQCGLAHREPASVVLLTCPSGGPLGRVIRASPAASATASSSACSWAAGG